MQMDTSVISILALKVIVVCRMSKLLHFMLL